MEELISSKARSCSSGIQDILQVIECLNENTTMVEIGSYAGESGKLFANSKKIIKLYCVDPWKNHYDDEHDSASWRFPMDKVETSFDIRMKPFISKYVKLKETSLDAYPKFADNSLDFVYIDGLHTFEGVFSDIQSWLPKIKLNGIISGHDYDKQRHSDVVKAVNLLLGIPDKTFCYYSWIKYLNKDS